MNTDLTDDQIEKLCAHLLGTTNSIETSLDLCLKLDLTEEDLSLATLNKIDDRIFCCVQCGWWCSVEEDSEIASCNSNLVCRECGGDDDQERAEEDGNETEDEESSDEE